MCYHRPALTLALSWEKIDSQRCSPLEHGVAVSVHKTNICGACCVSGIALGCPEDKVDKNPGPPEPWSRVGSAQTTKCRMEEGPRRTRVVRKAYRRRWRFSKAWRRLACPGKGPEAAAGWHVGVPVRRPGPALGHSGEELGWINKCLFCPGVCDSQIEVWIMGKSRYRVKANFRSSLRKILSNILLMRRQCCFPEQTATVDRPSILTQCPA